MTPITAVRARIAVIKDTMADKMYDGSANDVLKGTVRLRSCRQDVIQLDMIYFSYHSLRHPCRRVAGRSLGFTLILPKIAFVLQLQRRVH